MVVDRPVFPDFGQFGEVSGEFARGVVPGNVRRGLKDPGRLVLGELGVEVGKEPGFDPFGLPDVEHVAHGVDHLVDAGPVLGQRLDPGPKGIEVGGRGKEGARHAFSAGTDSRRR